jgi:hypothetical protein
MAPPDPGPRDTDARRAGTRAGGAFVLALGWGEGEVGTGVMGREASGRKEGLLFVNKKKQKNSLTIGFGVAATPKPMK